MTRTATMNRITNLLAPAGDNVFLTVKEIANAVDAAPSTVRRALRDERFCPKRDDDGRCIAWARREGTRYSY